MRGAERAGHPEREFIPIEKGHRGSGYTRAELNADPSLEGRVKSLEQLKQLAERLPEDVRLVIEKISDALATSDWLKVNRDQAKQLVAELKRIVLKETGDASISKTGKLSVKTKLGRAAMAAGLAFGGVMVSEQPIRAEGIGQTAKEVVGQLFQGYNQYRGENTERRKTAVDLQRSENQKQVDMMRIAGDMAIAKMNALERMSETQSWATRDAISQYANIIRDSNLMNTNPVLATSLIEAMSKTLQNNAASAEKTQGQMPSSINYTEFRAGPTAPPNRPDANKKGPAAPKPTK